MLAYLRKGETYADLVCGFGVGIRTVYRYVREGIDLLAAMAPTLEQAIEVAKGKAFVTLDGSLHPSHQGRRPLTPPTPAFVRRRRLMALPPCARSSSGRRSWWSGQPWSRSCSP